MASRGMSATSKQAEAELLGRRVDLAALLDHFLERAERAVQLSRSIAFSSERRGRQGDQAGPRADGDRGGRRRSLRSSAEPAGDRADLAGLHAQRPLADATNSRANRKSLLLIFDSPK